MMGHAVVHRPQVPALADVPFERDPDGKTHFVRVRSSVEVDGRVHVAPVTGQGSHQLASMAGADALVVLPDGGGVPAGAEVATMLLG
jgi:molybdopterin biosynthesis enzyme